jgi:biopolymer transport protein ExbB
LKSPGAIKVRIPEGVDRALGYVFIPGTSHFAFLKNAPDFVVLDSVPACVIPEIAYSSSAIPDISVIRYNIPIDPGDTTVVNEPFWKYSCQVVLNTSSTGAAISGDVMDFPVCIRLTSANFVFSQASPEGADIRFAKHDNTSLPYEIERWDAANERAELWVKVDTVRGNNASQAIVMYWGNPAVSGRSNGAAVFDTAKGFQGIWHLGGADSIAPDATGNRYNGNAYFTASVPGMIGNARHFNGRSSYIRMRGTAPQSRLNFPMSGNYMISAWIYHDTLADSVTYLIAGKGERQYFMKTFGLAQSTAQHAHQWEFTEYHGNNIWQAATQVPAASKAWTHLVGIRDGSNQYLYVNGALAMAGYRVFGTGQDTVQRDTTDDFAIGAFLRPVADWGQGYAYFKGTIDEVEVSSVPRSADWIKLSYMNQKEPDALVQFK